jgi:hypothetical protein
MPKSRVMPESSLLLTFRNHFPDFTNYWMRCLHSLPVFRWKITHLNSPCFPHKYLIVNFLQESFRIRVFLQFPLRRPLSFRSVFFLPIHLVPEHFLLISNISYWSIHGFDWRFSVSNLVLLFQTLSWILLILVGRVHSSRELEANSLLRNKRINPYEYLGGLIHLLSPHDKRLLHFPSLWQECSLLFQWSDIFFLNWCLVLIGNRATSQLLFLFSTSWQ